MPNFTPIFIFLTFGVVAGGTTGCSSSNQNYTYGKVTLNEIRQTPGGRLALIYEEKLGQPPGQRVFLVNQTPTANFWKKRAPLSAAVRF